jgi:heme/copper-type cytochrome/quinol oxidase subunit 3
MPTTLEQKKTHLDVLAVFHYVYGGLTALFGLVILAFLAVGMGAASGWGNDWEPEAGCSILAVIFVVFVLLGGTAVLNFLAARNLQRRRGYILVLVTAALNCTSVPFGTLLGIFTLAIVANVETRRLFDEHAPASLPAAE